ncbi:MAG: exonuclease SbcCD subunit D, partial [Anaerolineae bacterium]|nr:exonuclease SbcCD subunit D [Anaerolineae bacterium]
LERIDFGEEGERKGFVLVELERGRADWTFTPVDARPFITIRIDVSASSDPMTEILDELDGHNVDGAIVRLIIKATEEQESVLDDKPIRQALRSASYVASVARDIDRAQRHRLGGLSAEELTPRQVLELYLDSKGTPENRRAELLRHADAIFREE